MQQTFEINAGKINPKFFEKIIATAKAQFGTHDLKITIEDIQPETHADQRELSKKVLALRERFKHVKVDPNLDLSALANEMLGE